MRCSYRDGGARGCVEVATFWLIDPDGKRNPGGWVCRRHGQAIVKEYREKLGEGWTLALIDEYGDPVNTEGGKP